MATIRRRQGKWQVQVRRQGFKAVSRTFNQYKDAERWGLLEERRLDDLESRGLSQAMTCGLTVAELLTRYRETVVPLKRGSAVEEYIIRAMERASFAGTKADRLSVPALLEWRAQRLKLVAASTFQRELGLLGHAFEIARREWGFLALRNPVRDVPKLRLPPGRSRRLSRTEELRLRAEIQNCRNPQILPLMTFALETSMRLGEMLAMRWEHYDRDGRVVLLPISKNGKPRTVPLSLAAVEVLEGQDQAADFVFPTTSEAVKRVWIRLVKRCGIEDLHFHDLRHEAISRLVERGFDLPHVMMFSGHTDYRMLLRYTHLSARKLVAKLDASQSDITLVQKEPETK